MENIASWVAPIATMLAAVMTAANLGSRVTGWGFVVFSIGSVCWATIGIGSGQSNLIATNVFLTLVNVVGIWRWLGRQARYDDVARTAVAESKKHLATELFTAGAVAGMPVHASTGNVVGQGVEAMFDCATGGMDYLVVRCGGVAGIGEKLVAVPQASLRFFAERFDLNMSEDQFDLLPVWEPPSTPSHAEASA